MADQQFTRGDLVHVEPHFTADVDAIVLYSYADEYGGDDHETYSLHLRGKGALSWYYGSQLTLIEHGRLDLLETWEDEREAEIELKGGLDWIFDHGPEVLEKPHGATIIALGQCLGITGLWGSNGEGFIYYENARRILNAAQPFLETRDKAGWLARCEAEK